MSSLVKINVYIVTIFRAKKYVFGLLPQLHLIVIVFFSRLSISRQMDSPIRYLKLIGGPRDCESVLIGLKNGGVYQVFVNNPFPQLLAKQNGVIYCVDMNINRTKVAVIDDTLTLYVYNVQTKELLYQVGEKVQS